MDENRETFETEGEAIAFCEGLEAAAKLLDEGRCILPTITTDRFVEGDRWVVVYE
jgi:hypothetical protein